MNNNIHLEPPIYPPIPLEIAGTGHAVDLEMGLHDQVNDQVNARQNANRINQLLDQLHITGPHERTRHALRTGRDVGGRVIGMGRDAGERIIGVGRDVGGRVIGVGRDVGEHVIGVGRDVGGRVIDVGRDVGERVIDVIGQGITTTGHSMKMFATEPLKNRAWGAMAGHLLQQMVTCGGPTLLREEAFIEAYNVILPHLTKKYPGVTVGLQVAVSLLSIVAHYKMREPRMQRAQDDSVAPRGYFGLSPEEFENLPQDERDAMQNAQANGSEWVTSMQLVAEILNTVMSVAGAATGNHALTTRVLSSQIRNILYAATREPLQATLSMTGATQGTPTFGVNDAHMAINGAWYTAMTLAMGVMQDAVIQSALPKGYSVSGPELRDASGKSLQGNELHQMAIKVAGIRAICNSAIESVDAFLGKHYDTKQVNDSQAFSASLPMRDYGRLLDHSIARLSWNNFANSSTQGVQQAISKIGGQFSEDSGQLGNIVAAAAFGLSYKMVNQTYQAHAKVRAAVASGN